MDLLINHQSEASMAKKVQMSIKMEQELRDQFMAVAAGRHRPAAQIIRDLMRLYIADNEMPNTLTADTLRKSRDGEDVFHASSPSDLFKQLDI
jgi:predicted DNA-binding protein